MFYLCLLFSNRSILKHYFLVRDVLYFFFFVSLKFVIFFLLEIDYVMTAICSFCLSSGAFILAKWLWNHLEIFKGRWYTSTWLPYGENRSFDNYVPTSHEDVHNYFDDFTELSKTINYKRKHEDIEGENDSGIMNLYDIIKLNVQNLSNSKIFDIRNNATILKAEKRNKTNYRISSSCLLVSSLS